MALANKLDVALREPERSVAGGDGGLSVPCKVASVVWDDSQRRYQSYQTLVYVLALIALAGIGAAIVFFFVVDDKASAGIVSLIGGLLSGGLARFIKTERDTARDDRNAANEIVREECAGQTAEAVVSSLAR